MDEKLETYYKHIFDGTQPPFIGEALIKGGWKNVELIDDRLQDGRVRVCYHDDQGRRCTSYVTPENVKYF